MKSDLVARIFSFTPLTPIDFRKLETFAHACEAYSRILEHAGDGAERRRLLSEYVSTWMPADERVEPDDLFGALTEAVGARNGWKRILQHCAPPPRGRRDNEVVPGEGIEPS